MRYNYSCDKCKNVTTINKVMAESSRVEYCTKCKNVLTRVYTTPAISTNDGFKK